MCTSPGVGAALMPVKTPPHASLYAVLVCWPLCRHTARSSSLMFKHLLVPIDGGALDERAMEAGIDLARQLRAAITGFLVEPPAATGGSGHGAWHHVEEMALHQQAAARHAERVLRRFEERAEAGGVPFEGVFARARQVDAAIADAARQRGCDMIVMVTHGRGPFGELLFGACTKGVMARSPLPLLVLHAEPPARRQRVAAPDARPLP